MGKQGQNPLNDGKIMMDGTGSRKSYMVFARRGDIALGIQFQGAAKSAHMKGCYAFTLRLRAADGAGKLFKDEDKAGGVVNLSDSKATPANAFDFKWEKQYDNYASTTVIHYAQIGSDHGTEQEKQDAYYKHLASGAIGRDMAKFLVVNINPEHLILSQSEIAEWINGYFRKGVADHTKQKAFSDEVNAALLGFAGKTIISGDIEKLVNEIKAKHYPPEVEEKAEDVETDETQDEDETDE
jgi:hypothetical protein